MTSSFCLIGIAHDVSIDVNQSTAVRSTNSVTMTSSMGKHERSKNQWVVWKTAAWVMSLTSWRHRQLYWMALTVGWLATLLTKWCHRFEWTLWRHLYTVINNLLWYWYMKTGVQRVFITMTSSMYTDNDVINMNARYDVININVHYDIIHINAQYDIINIVRNISSIRMDNMTSSMTMETMTSHTDHESKRRISHEKRWTKTMKGEKTRHWWNYTTDAGEIRGGYSRRPMLRRLGWYGRDAGEPWKCAPFDTAASCC